MGSALSDHTNKDFGFLSGGAELGELIRGFDWSRTPLGAVDWWPRSLRSALSICLNSNFPIAIYWGKDLHLLYNDAWKSIPGHKHPAALGLSAKEVWPEIWNEIQPQFEKAFSGQPGGAKDALLPMRRHGYTEECYFDFTFTPIYGEKGRVEGVFNAVIETTYRVISERRTTLLKELPIQLAQAANASNAFELAAEFIKKYPQDIPFCVLYKLEGNTAPVAVASTVALPSQGLLLKALPVSELTATAGCVYLTEPCEYLSFIPPGFWPEPVTEAVLVPIRDSAGMINGFMFCLLSPRLRYDQDYKIFLESVAGAVSTVAQNIEALEFERKRSEELMQLDQAKTTFFTNISHEFRTPLTLLLGPVEELMANASIKGLAGKQLETVYRNALRMQKLVNNLLEFSRIEAGRVQANFTRVDIGALTRDLASTFRSAIETAGLVLDISISPVESDVYVDVDMWEKIILNLISNAFKFTQHGRIAIQVNASRQFNRSSGERYRVWDTP